MEARLANLPPCLIGMGPASSRRQLEAEILVLRNQLNVLRQRAPRARPWTFKSIPVFLRGPCGRELTALAGWGGRIHQRIRPRATSLDLRDNLARGGSKPDGGDPSRASCFASALNDAAVT